VRLLLPERAAPYLIRLPEEVLSDSATLGGKLDVPACEESSKPSPIRLLKSQVQGVIVKSLGVHNDVTPVCASQ
jgi:hypothetical protein